MEVRAQATATCEPILAAADERYILREYDEAEALARACLAQARLDTGEAIQAYRLLALIALRQENLAEAETSVAQLLTISPDYAPDPVQDPPGYVDLIEVVKERIQTDSTFPPADSVRVTPLPVENANPPIDIVQTDSGDAEMPIVTRVPPQERRGITRWLLIGGGVVVAGLAAVLLTTGGSSSPPAGGTPLPPPPSFPN